MSSCIFCQIVTGKIPAEKIYEDEQFLAFLDIRPIAEGHTLVIPKKHYRWVHDVEKFGLYWEKAQKIAQAQIKTLDTPSVVFVTAGLEVPHAHIHLIPMIKTKEGIFLAGIELARRLETSPDELKKTAAKILSAVK